MRFEAARCPQVMRVDPAEVAPRPPNSWRGSDRSGSALVAPPPIADAPDWAKPGDGWVRQFVAVVPALLAQVPFAYEGGGAQDSARALESQQRNSWRQLSHYHHHPPSPPLDGAKRRR